MQGDLKLVNINDERFWDTLFDEACVEGQQAARIRNELEKIIAYDVEKVVTELEEENQRLKKLRNDCIALSDHEVCDIENKAYNFAIKCVRNGWKE